MPAASPAARTPPYAVGYLQVRVVDTAADTPPRGDNPMQHDRQLRTSVWFPRGAGTGRFPLVVFAHGFDVTPLRYARFLHQVAQAGYVVAAPLFPISGAGLPGPPREDDMPSQVTDVRAVIDAMTARVPGAPAWLARLVDRQRVAVMGHSDGAETAVAMALIPADRDARVSALVILAGQLPTWGPFRPTDVPVLVEQATGDTVNPPWRGWALYRRLHRPKAYLNVLGGDHIDVITGTGRQAAAVRAAIIAFLDTELTTRPSQRPGADARLRRLANRPGVLTLTDQL